MATAIGKRDYSGRVRGAGGTWGLRDYFGPTSRRTTADSCSQEALHKMEMQFEEKLNQIRQSLQQEFDEKIESLARSQQQTQGTPQTIEHDVVRVSTKGSCAATAADPLGEYTQTDASHQCELYVEDDPPRLVAIGRVFEGGLTIHGVPLQADWTRVVVDEVHDANAPVPFPNEEIQLVGRQAGHSWLGQDVWLCHYQHIPR